jgi:hypothetical protein
MSEALATNPAFKGPQGLVNALTEIYAKANEALEFYSLSLDEKVDLTDRDKVPQVMLDLLDYCAIAENALAEYEKFQEGLGAQHVVHSWADSGPKLSLKAEKNSKGYNWEVSISSAKDVDEAMRMLAETDARLKTQFASPVEKTE